MGGGNLPPGFRTLGGPRSDQGLLRQSGRFPGPRGLARRRDRPSRNLPGIHRTLDRPGGDQIIFRGGGGCRGYEIKSPDLRSGGRRLPAPAGAAPGPPLRKAPQALRPRFRGETGQPAGMAGGTRAAGIYLQDGREKFFPLPAGYFFRLSLPGFRVILTLPEYIAIGIAIGRPGAGIFPKPEIATGSPEARKIRSR